MRKKKSEIFQNERQQLIDSGALIVRIPEGNQIFKAKYKYFGTKAEIRSSSGNIVVQVWNKDAVAQAIKDRLHTEHGWEKAWILVDSIEHIHTLYDEQEDRNFWDSVARIL